ncbi:DNA mismatch repair protein MutS core domain-containing protein [Dioscorea alata]|uniref:DNA mismatch repair protein MutS core domain-containing protein n=1 Tax=Dioscorea alata TaxID=55571 RepID=A0ACB7VVI2_DIOAL|nr:DNA mismatch repair protein MutS core domain-containing protein [Dioscorea alata]
MADSDPALPSSDQVLTIEERDGPKLIGLEIKISPDEKEDLQEIGAKFAELNESQSELLSRLQKLREDMKNWSITLDKQVATYKDELKTMKESLNSELDQLRSELRTTLQKQQEDVSDSLRNLGMEDPSEHSKRTGTQDANEAQSSPTENSK